METSYQYECECGFKTVLFAQRGNAETAWIIHRSKERSKNPEVYVPHTGGTVHKKQKVNFTWKESGAFGFPEGIQYEEGFLK